MADQQLNDPFHWDTDGVCNHFCTPGVKWTNDPAGLRKRIQHHELDGETLLAFDFSLPNNALMEFLGLAIAKHIMQFSLEIKRLRARSPAFAHWKKIQLAPDTIAEQPASSMPSPKRQLSENTLMMHPRAHQEHQPEVKRRKVAPSLIGEPGSVATQFPSPPRTNLQTNLEHDEFSYVAPQDVSATRRYVAYRQMKRDMYHVSRQESMLQCGEVERAASESADDEVVDLSDLDGSLDEETRREMELDAESEEEDEALNRKPTFLPQEQVRHILEERICEMKNEWNRTKRPKAERRAYQLWLKAKKTTSKQEICSSIRSKLASYDKQRKKVVEGILSEQWPSEDAVSEQACSLTQSIFEMKYCELDLATLNAKQPPKPPPQPATASQPKTPKQRRRGRSISLDSSDDEFVPDEVVPVPTTPTKSKHGGSSQLDVPVIRTGDDVIDLTKTPERIASSTANKNTPNEVVDLTGAPQAIITDTFNDADTIAAIGVKSPKIFEKEKARFKLVISLLWQLIYRKRQGIFSMARHPATEDTWNSTLQCAFSAKAHKDAKNDAKPNNEMVRAFTAIFWSFWKCKVYSYERIANLKSKKLHKDINRLKDAQPMFFPKFCQFITEISSHFPAENAIFRHEDLIQTDDESPVENLPGGKEKNKKKVYKEIVENREAQAMREKDAKKIKDSQLNAAILEAQLRRDGISLSDPSKIVINTSKRADQALIFINASIGAKIKPHQIDGVRFLWERIVVDSKERQGCLLSHTMGLGKTMQTITLLITIAECANSPDLAIKSQIPKDLMPLRTLILCPAGLVNNWIAEIRQWDTCGVLEFPDKIHSELEANMRITYIKAWIARGGVLVMGYEMFANLLKRADDQLRYALLKTPNMVIADEAHKLKNQKSKIAQKCSQFETPSRIALTGSPMANNVEEYYSMIEWLAPGYLGPLAEFSDIFVKPIHEGLYSDSNESTRRLALRLLQTLKLRVAPKVNRATIHALKDDLPEKLEFVISVTPTDLQRQLYNIYIDGLQSSNADKEEFGQGKVFGILSHLDLICSHPRCFQTKTLEIQEFGDKSRNEDDSDPNAKGDKNHKSHAKSYPKTIIPKVLAHVQPINMNDFRLSRKVELLCLILDDAKTAREKVLVFSQSLTTLDFLQHLFQAQGREYCRLDGSTPTSKRQQDVSNFNNGTTQVYLISTTAGGVGLNIQSASRVVIFDQKWNPVHDQQAIGRAYRMGQKKRVVVYRFITAGTFEQDVQNKSVFKMQLAARVVDKKSPIRWSKRNGKIIHRVHSSAIESPEGLLGQDRTLDKMIVLNRARPIIQKIMSADTFEEEDPTDSLTAMEKQTAEQMFAADCERVSNPGSFSKTNQVLLGYTADPSAQVLRPNVFPNTEKEQPDSTQQIPGTVPDWMRNFPAASRLISKAVPKPIAGANTFFAHETNSPRTLPASGTASTATNNTLITHSAAASSEAASTLVSKQTPGRSRIAFQAPPVTKKEAFEKALLEQFSRMKPGMVKNTISAEESVQFVASIISQIRVKEALGFLYDNNHWEMLTRIAQGQPGLVVALAKGTIDASSLALISEVDLSKKIATLDAMALAESTSHVKETSSQDQSKSVASLIPGLTLL